MKRLLATAAMLLALDIVTERAPAHAQDNESPLQLAQLSTAELIKQRRATMKELGEHMRAVIDFIKGAAGTPEEVKGHTLKIKAIAEAIPEMFPEGSGMGDDIMGVETGAKQEIWTDAASFEASASFLSAEAAKLDALSANGDRSAMAQQFMLVGRDGCSGCHEDFRHKLPGTD